MGRKRRAIPKFDHPLIETHCHLDYLEQMPLDDILQQSREVGVERFISIAVEPGNQARVREIAEQYPDVYATQGIHPHEASGFDGAENTVREGLQSSKVVALGETGLDYYYDYSDRSIQRRVFARQLEIAAEADLPVVIHTRDADDDTIAILGEHAGSLSRKGVIHCFTSTPRLAEFCLEQGFYLGFTGIVTFNKAENVREVVRLTPLERLLLETDSPFLAPVPYRGKEAAPFYLPFVAEKIAQIKDVDVESLLATTYRNATQLFFDRVA